MSSDPARAQTIQQWLTTARADFQPIDTLRPAALEQPPRASATAGIELKDEIGQGGMATVYCGEQLSLGREVAVKVERSNRQEGMSSSMLHEAWLTSSLEHPNIVPVYDLLSDSAGDLMVLMRRIEGTAWGELLGEDQRLLRDYAATDPVEWHLRVFLQVCNAIDFAHSVGVLHRDIKPDNIMIGDHGEVYLLDWGIAIAKRGALAEKLRPLTASGLAGTPCYLAPEMMTGDADLLDERTDLYLLGATMYHVVTNRPPHRGHSLREVLDSVTRGDVEIPDDLPEELRGILAKSLAHAPEARYQTVAELRTAVEEFLSHRSSHRLAALAQETYGELRAALQSRHLGSQRDRAALYKLYSTCRTSFRGALDLWGENPAALEGLYQATDAMIDAEIAHGTPRAATALLSELDDPPEELACKVADAQHTEDREQEDMQHMASIARNLSPLEGARIRCVLTLLLGVSYATCLLLVGDRMGLRELLVADLIGLGCIAGYAALIKVRWQLNSFDQRTIGILALILSIQALRNAFGILTDTPRDVMLAGSGLLYLMTGLVVAVALDKRLWPLPLVYGIGYFAALLEPAHTMPTQALGHLFVGVYAAWVWWPRKSSQDTSSS